MTIEKQEPGVWFAFCDASGCSTHIELDTDPDDPFFEAVKEIREKGWYVTQVHGQWMHFCPDCKVEKRQQAAKLLGFDEDHRTGNERSGRSIKHSYTGEGKNVVD